MASLTPRQDERRQKMARWGWAGGLWFGGGMFAAIAVGGYESYWYLVPIMFVVGVLTGVGLAAED